MIGEVVAGEQNVNLGSIMTPARRSKWNSWPLSGERESIQELTQFDFTYLNISSEIVPVVTAELS